MDCLDAVNYGRSILDKYGLHDWSINIETSLQRFGLCEYRNKSIYISNWHIKINTDYDVKRTIIHEVAHALTQGCRHNPVWKRKFEALLNIELGYEVVRNRFGKGKVASKADIKKMNTFKLEL